MPPRVRTLRRSDFPDFVLEFMAEAGYPLEQEYLIDALPTVRYDPAAYRVTPTTPTRSVDDGDVIDLGRREPCSRETRSTTAR
jgi:hypothetical protein